MAAQTEYLKGNWIEAEAILRKLLRRSPRDVEALLLLATMQRRTGRFDQARQQLQQMSRLDAAQPWHVEIRDQRELLRRKTEQQRLEEIEETGEAAADVEESIELPAADREENCNSFVGTAQETRVEQETHHRRAA